MVKLSDKQIEEIDALHVAIEGWLLEIVDGRVNADDPQPITLENASCLIAKVMFNTGQIQNIIHETRRTI